MPLSATFRVGEDPTPQVVMDCKPEVSGCSLTLDVDVIDGCAEAGTWTLKARSAGFGLLKKGHWQAGKPEVFSGIPCVPLAYATIEGGECGSHSSELAFEESRQLSVRLDPASWFTVKVIDSDTGEPIEGVEITGGALNHPPEATNAEGITRVQTATNMNSLWIHEEGYKNKNTSTHYFQDLKEKEIFEIKLIPLAE